MHMDNDPIIESRQEFKILKKNVTLRSNYVRRVNKDDVVSFQFGK